jgi:hypothetical protein
MKHLLYSSDEMYSSTQLIRKSKVIFDKITSNKIDKAIILRDGKPSFILLDFDKYEKIMAEYTKLKTKNKTKDNTTTICDNTKKIEQKKEAVVPFKTSSHNKVELKEFWE